MANALDATSGMWQGEYEKNPTSLVHDPTGKDLMMKVKQLRFFEVLLHYGSVQNTALLKEKK